MSDHLQQFRHVFAFELKYRLRQPAFYVFSLLFFALTFTATSTDSVQIGGGIGNAVVWPQVQALKDAGNKVIAILGARTKELLILEDEITALDLPGYGNSDAPLPTGDRYSLRWYADVVVFDPETVLDEPGSGREPARRPRGIEHVFVNGIHAVSRGRYQPSARAGQVLRT